MTHILTTSRPMIPPTPSDNEEAAIIKVSSHSRPTAVAGAIAGVMREQGHAEIQAIGAAAVYQAVKAIAIARNYLTEETDIAGVPTFTNVMIDGQERTAIRFLVKAIPLQK